MKINRREFMTISGAAILARPILSLAQTVKKKIIVAGAGLSGLSTAYQLAKNGFEVTVIEGRDRIGGRVFSLREPFKDGQYVELGGELVGDGYKRLLGYAKEFSIDFEEVTNDTATGGSVTNLQKGITTSAILKGKLYPAGTILDNPYNLKGDEGSDLPPNILIKQNLAMAGEVRANPAKLAEFDQISLAEALRKRGVSAEMIRLMNISLNYNDIETVSTGGILWESRKRIGAGTKAIKIKGGNDLVPKALYENAQKLGVKFILKSKIKQISHTENSVKVSFSDAKGKMKTVEADKLVCTIPFSVLREIQFTPNLPDAKQKSINELAYTHITKVFLQARRENWDKQNIGASLWTDTPCERIFNAAGKRGDKRGIFTIWTDGIGAKIPESFSDKKRIEWGRKEFVKTLPFMKGLVESSATKSWTNDEFVRGSYSHFAVGQLTTLQPFLKTQIGAIHFAGEHTAEKSPGMEGALESAERVVSEISAVSN